MNTTTQTKSSRLALLRSRYAALFGVALTSGLIAPSRAEVRGVAQSVKSEVADGMDDSTATGDEFAPAKPEFTSLRFEPASGGFGLRGESDSHFILTPAERRELAKTYHRNKLAGNQFVKAAAPVVNLAPDDELLPPDFVPAPVEEFVPAIPAGAAWVIEATLLGESEARFEADVAALPLLLTYPAPVAA